MSLFDQYMIIDWSAANSPKHGKDSIWIALADGRANLLSLENPRTRSDAIEMVRIAIITASANRKRLFAGFDFAFGYPAGAASILTGTTDWRAMWQALTSLIRDDDHNRSNRFEIAGALNRKLLPDRSGPFWGHPHQHTYEQLGPKKPEMDHAGFKERRIAEEIVTGAKTVWQLAYNGSVGSQSLLGIPRLHQLAAEPDLKEHIAVWPFETTFADDLSKTVIIAEIYPSAFPVTQTRKEVKDAAQVRTLACGFARLDQQDQFKVLLSRPECLTDEQAVAVLAEEGWIVGAGHEHVWKGQF